MGDDAPIIQSHHQAQYYMPPPISYSQLLLGGENYHELTQHIQSPNVIPPASASVTWNSQSTDILKHASFKFLIFSGLCINLYILH
ncbi:Hypothetical predicted protein [Olea europaea subsp. europaea]|uniref:Uncharacterized protein n=1 Tax=Olea europaea subsp. europaea TaxID=158383 RepID=A0A8S0RUB0_OLEEU|nr:Hypothetical predicted protein [Olea europaea subsp. europaea]